MAQKISILFPVGGILIFAMLYFIATLYYPGGSPFDTQSVGFSWSENFWCNLLNDDALNGKNNDAKPIALTGFMVLCISLAYFWWMFPWYVQCETKYALTIRICGVLSMLLALLLCTNIDHDLVTGAAGFFGLLAMSGVMTALYKNDWKTLFYFGMVNILLIAVNNILYYSPDLIWYLPVVQKITFVTILAWVSSITLKIFWGYSEKPV